MGGKRKPSCLLKATPNSALPPLRGASRFLCAFSTLGGSQGAQERQAWAQTERQHYVNEPNLSTSWITESESKTLVHRPSTLGSPSKSGAA